MTDVEVALTDVGPSRVGVTGALGFVGRTFLARREVHWSTLPIGDLDFVIHLAARPHDELATFLDNVTLDATVFEFCSRNNIGLIYASGNNVYPLLEDCSETDPVCHSDYYSLSKIVGERICASSVFDSLQWVTLRIADVFGFGQRHGALFTAVADALGARAPLKLYGTGSKTRSYIYSKELARGLEFCVKNFSKLSRQVFNFCHDEPVNVEALLGLIAEASGLGIERVEHKGRSDTRTMNNEKIKSYGYRFEYSLRAAIRDFTLEASGN